MDCGRRLRFVPRRAQAVVVLRLRLRLRDGAGVSASASADALAMRKWRWTTGGARYYSRWPGCASAIRSVQR
jgi:hypothetical protein